MCGDLSSFVFEPVLERDGVSVSKSPWGPDDQIGRLNWITPETTAEIMGRLDGRHVFDLSVDYFKGMPSWIAAGDPVYDIWMTHTPDGAVIDGLAGVEPHLLEKYSYSGDAIQMYVHCGTHLDTLNHFGHWGLFWNGWNQKEHLGSRHWLARWRRALPAHHRPLGRPRRCRHARHRLPRPGARDHAAGAEGRREAPGRRASAEGHRADPDWPHDGLAGRAGIHHRPAGHRPRGREVAVRGDGRDDDRLGQSLASRSCRTRIRRSSSPSTPTCSRPPAVRSSRS